MKKLLVTFLTLLCLFNLWADDNYYQSKPSVNAEMFKLPAESKNSLNEGQLSFSISLPNLEGKGYNLPISLTFYAGNITHLSDASPVGLGWSLNAGGSICIAVNDKEDSQITQKSDAPWQFDGNYISYNNVPNYNPERLITNMRRDRSPDSYSYALPDRSGDILDIIDESGHSFFLSPDVEYVMNEYSGTNGGYTIKDDQGNEFIFDEKEITSGNDNDNHTTAWFLSTIKTCQGGTFSFEYAPEAYSDYMEPYYIHNDDIGFKTKRTKRITKITSDYGYIAFSSVTRSDRKSVHEDSISKCITSIAYYSKGNSSPEYTYRFDYDYIRGHNLSQDDVSQIFFESESNERLILKKIDILGNDNEPSMPPYIFEYDSYFEHSKINWTSNLWAYSSWSIFCVPDLSLNGNLAAQLLFDYNNRPFGYLGYQAVSYEYDGTYDEYFIMTSAKFPTQKEETYIYYDTHSFTNINNKVDITGYCSGKVLKYKITDEKDTIEYKYYNGSINNIPITNAIKYDLMTVDDYRQSMGELYVASRIVNPNKTPHNAYIGQPVHYNKVHEIFKENGQIKKTIEYLYSNSYVVYPTNYIYTLRNNRVYNILEIENGIFRASERHQNFWDVYLGDQIQALFLYPLESIELGPQPYLRRVNHYDENNLLVKSVVNTYNDIVYSKPVRYAYKYIQSGDSYLISRSCKHPGKWMLNSTTSIEYIYNNSICNDSIITKVEYIRRTPNRIKDVKKTYLGQTTFTHNIFIDDIISKNDANNKPIDNIFYQMWSKNLLGLPIQQSTKRNDVTQTANLNVFKVSRYNKNSNIYAPIWQYIVRLDSILTYESDGHNTIANPMCINNKLIHDHSLKWNTNYRYANDSVFQPEYVRKKGAPGMLIEWDDNMRHPLAVIKNYPGQSLNTSLKTTIRSLQLYKNITNENLQAVKNLHQQIQSQMPHSYTPVDCTVYTYNDNGQITSTSNSNGELFFYLYDHAGRLSKIVDKDFNPVESYKYKYKDR